ncbi:MAG: rhomboid family intramembrane serine protease [Steroidobacter sp.]
MIPLRDDNPSSIAPVVTIAFVVACVLVFLWQASLGAVRGEQIVYSLGVIPAVLLGQGELPPELVLVPPAMTTLTSMFMHGGWMHLIGNMLYLWIFGDNVEDSMGHARFVVFYLLCGLAAVFAQALPEPGSTIPMVGASGAISGVLGAYLLLYPHARVLVAIPFGFILHTTRIPAGLVLAFWFGLQLLSNMMATPGEGGVAFRAHIGGFIAGMALIPFFKRQRFRLWMPKR